MKYDAAKWTANEQARFLLELGDLLENGFTLNEGIEFSMIHGKRKHRKGVQEGIDLLKEGHAFRDFLEWLNFNQELIGLIAYGEENGQLAQALHEGGKIWLKKSEDRSKLKNLLYYPSFLFVFSFVLLQLFSTYLFPRFTTMYQDTNQGSNIFLKIAEFMSSSFQNLPLILIFLSTLMIVYYQKRFKNFSEFKKEQIYESFPIIRTFRRLSITYYFSIQLGSLLKGGISVADAFQFMNQKDPKKLVREISGVCIEKLQVGDSLENILNDLGMFKGDLQRVVSHGQRNGLLGEELLYYSRLILKELEYLTEKCLKIIQPLMFGMVAVLIILLYLAILMPMISMMNTI